MDPVSLYISRYYEVTDSLTSQQRTDSEFARGQALAYLWGRMDQGGLNIKPDVIDSFSWAYATMHALYAARKVSTTRPLRDSWKSFVTTGAIHDYNGKALDRISRALNDPTVDCCGRDAADCDCEES